MAAIGDQLLQPERGWKRYDDTDSNISYVGDWGNGSASAYYKDYRHECKNTSINSKIKFNFTGNKLLLLSSLYPGYSNKIEIKIDNSYIGHFSQDSSTTNRNQHVCYVNTSLKDKEHCVEITKINKGNYSVDFILDAIDIDENGELKPYNENPYVYKYLIKQNNILYILNGTDLVQAPSQILDEDNFINNGFTDTDLLTKDLLLSKFENLDEIKFLVYIDGLEKNKCEMIYNCEPFRPIDKLKKNSDICNILFKEV
ncbi:cell adhesion protein [Clostridium botulinum]